MQGVSGRRRTAVAVGLAAATVLAGVAAQLGLVVSASAGSVGQAEYSGVSVARHAVLLEKTVAPQSFAATLLGGVKKVVKPAVG
jgi:hypothetical protein